MKRLVASATALSMAVLVLGTGAVSACDMSFVEAMAAMPAHQSELGHARVQDAAKTDATLVAALDRTADVEAMTARKTPASE